ncbi:MAG TPA: bifunctional shikimate kinase/3-dehydroquinate synthase [Candidatus Limnocylindria bacterium]|nr:bifunctional shikimate kinase/3-dehydroquinate synthase [Candidatus Limnocylindria bacterium]
MTAEPLPAPPLPPGRPNLVLSGLMGAGKSTCGAAAAAALGLPFVDLDAVVERRAGRTVAEIFAAGGEAAFRALERAAVADAARLSSTVIAAGGGAPADRASFASLARTGVSALLSVTPAEAVRRVGAASARPLLAGDARATLERLAVERGDAYAAAGEALDTSARTAEDVTRELVGRYRSAAAPGPLRLDVRIGDVTTRVVVGDGILAAAARELGAAAPDVTRAIVVADSAVLAHVQPIERSLREGGFSLLGPVAIPAGEAAKTLATVDLLWRRFQGERIDPSCAVIAVGGGAALDAAGFAAATYARGLPLVNVPTTTLAMADAALGGKVAIDHAGAKNLVGAYHPARLVLADPAVCRTLGPSTTAEGLAEIVKAGILASPLVAELAADAPLEWLLEQALRVKAAYVAADPRDAGVRRSLNLGHTFAHAIESASEHRVSHGAAVAMGLVAAARLGAALGTCPPRLADDLARTLAALGLPTRAPDLDRARMLAAMEADKKRSGGAVRFVVPAAGGAALVSGIAPRDALGHLA